MKTSFSGGFLILLTTLVLVMGGCTNNDADEVSYDLSGDWKVIYYLENGQRITKADKNTWPDVNNGDITARFSEPDADGKGTITGITVSNAYSGAYSLEGEDGKLSIGPLSTTFINEPEWTELYRVSAAQNFEVRNAQLFLFYNGGRNSIVFERN